MYGSRSHLRRTCPPPPHIKKAFDLCHFEAKAFLMGGGDGHARPAGGRALAAAASALWALAAAQKECL